MAPWKIPLIVAAIAVPIVAGFYVGGAAAGTALGAVAVATLLVIAARAKPRGPIEPAAAVDTRRHVLLVVTRPVEEPSAIAAIVEAGSLDRAGKLDVLVLAPARIGFLDRWASDVEGARQAAQESLVATVAALAKAGIDAEARVGDEDVLQAVEDQLQTYPATDVVLVTGVGEGDRQEAAIAELSSRLEPPLHRVELAG